MIENREEEHTVEEKNKRSSIFAVKDAENAVLWFCFYVVVLTVCVILRVFGRKAQCFSFGI